MTRRAPGLRLTLAAVIAAALLAAGAAALAAPPPMHEPVPPPPPDAGLDRPLYDDVPLDHYGIDADYSYADVAARQVHLLLTSAMVARAWLVKLAIRVAEQALTLRPAGALAQAADQVSAQLSDALWGESFAGPLVLAGLLAAGAWAMLVWLRRPGAAWRLLLGTGLVLAVAVAALLSLGGILRGLGDVSGDLAGLAFSAATQPIAGTGSAPAELRAVTAAGSAAWDTLVHQPWLDSEFTDPQAARQYAVRDVPGLALLQLTAEERLELYTSLPLHQRERLFAPWQVNRLPGRAVTALAASLAALIYALAVLLLAGAMLVYDLLLVALAALTPAAALLALWPPWGSRLATAWAGRLLGAALGKAIAALLLGAFFSISVALLEVSEPGGWPLAAVLLAGLAVAMWRVWAAVPVAAAALARARAPVPPAAAASPAAAIHRTAASGAAAAAVTAQALRAGGPAHYRDRPVPEPATPAREPAVARPQSVLLPAAAAAAPPPRQEFAAEMTRLRQHLVLLTVRDRETPRPAAVDLRGSGSSPAAPPPAALGSPGAGGLPGAGGMASGKSPAMPAAPYPGRAAAAGAGRKHLGLAPGRPGRVPPAGRPPQGPHLP